MTCHAGDGLVQVPCIERNAFGANKAVAAVSLALRGDGLHRVTLDEVIEIMRQTGADMQATCEKTSLGSRRQRRRLSNATEGDGLCEA